MDSPKEKDGLLNEESLSGKLTEQILKDLMIKPPKSRKIRTEIITKLQHELLSFKKDRALHILDESVDTLLHDMEYYECKFAEFLDILDRTPLFSPIGPCLEDLWFGYQQCAKRLYGHLKAEVAMVEEQVSAFKCDLDSFERICVGKIEHDEVDITPKSRESIEPMDTAVIDKGQTHLLDMEMENNELKGEICRLQVDNTSIAKEKEVMYQEISKMTDIIQNLETNQSFLTPRPVASLCDLVEILGDELSAENASSMMETLHSKGENVLTFLEMHLKQPDTDLQPELGGFDRVWRDIMDVQCDPDVLAVALARRVGPTAQKFELLERSYIRLQQENKDMKHQLASYHEVEEKRSLAKQRHEEEVHSERKDSIQRYLDMLADKGEDAWKDQLIGMGAGGDVPKLFRFVGKIRNKHMSKRDTEKLVREVWKDRSLGSKNTSLVDFLGNHLQKKVGIAAAVLELGYNFLFSLWRYQWDADCELFLKILVGITHEEVYIAQNNLQIDLEELFEALDKANGLSPGYIPKEELTVALRAFFRVGKLDGKSEKRFEEALHALDVDQPGQQVEWRKVFEEDREFNQGEFAECIRDQFLIEREELYDAIGVALYEECGEDNYCSCKQLASALIVARPTLGEKATIYASNVFQETEEDKVKISTALKFLSERSLEANEEDPNQTIQRKQKPDKPGLAGGKPIKQGAVQKRQNPLIAAALEEVRLFWMATTH